MENFTSALNNFSSALLDFSKKISDISYSLQIVSNKRNLNPSFDHSHIGSMVNEQPKKKQKKGKYMPKAAKNSFQCFSSEKRMLMRKTNPEMPFSELSKFIGQQWKALNDQDKEQYNELSRKDKIRYNQEHEEWLKDPKTWENNRRQEMLNLDKPNSAAQNTGLTASNNVAAPVVSHNTINNGNVPTSINTNGSATINQQQQNLTAKETDDELSDNSLSSSSSSDSGDDVSSSSDFAT